MTGRPATSPADSASRNAAGHAGPLVVLVVLVVWAYWPTFDHGFFAEDHNLVRYFREAPRGLLLDSTRDRLFGNHIGVDYYRPVSTFLLGAALWGLDANAVAIRLVHILLHVLNVWMIYALVASHLRDHRRRVGFGAAALFAIHPFGHVASAVISYYATLWCAFFLLFAMLAHSRSGRGWRAAALVSFGGALGSYELAPVLLPWLVLFERFARRRPWRGIVRTVVPYVLVFAAYFALRTAILGRTTGVAFFLADFAPFAAVQNVVAGFLKVLHPTFAGAFDRGLPLLVFWAVAAGIVLLLRKNLTEAARRRPALVLAVAWSVLVSLPFAAVPINLAVAKYWYLTATGAAVAVPLFCVPASRAPRWRRTLGYAVFLGVAVYHAGIQRTYLHMLRDLVSTENALRAHLLETRFGPDVEAVFVTDIPRCETSPIYGHADPLATSIGLNASLSPPIADAPFTAYFVRPEYTAIVRHLVANDERHAVISVGPPAPAPADAIDPAKVPRLPLVDVATRVKRTDGLRAIAIAFRAPGHRHVAIHMITELGWFDCTRTNDGAPDAPITVDVALNRVLSCPENHRARIFWWVDALDDAGRSVARSTLRSYHPTFAEGDAR